MKASELREKTSEELSENLAEAKRRLFFQMRMQSATGEGAKPHEAGALRREVARISTVLRERELTAGQNSSGSAEGADE